MGCGALVAAIVGACSSPTPTPTPTPPLLVDPSQLAPRDSWSAEFTFRDPVARSARHPTPAGGWLVTPLHGHLLPTGRVLLHGSEKESSAVTEVDPYVLFNDADTLP